jgi:hypothetical protein
LRARSYIYRKIIILLNYYHYYYYSYYYNLYFHGFASERIQIALKIGYLVGGPLSHRPFLPETDNAGNKNGNVVLSETF